MSNEPNESSRLLGDTPGVYESTTCCEGGFDRLADDYVGRTIDDDVVTLGLKRLCFAFGVTIGLWLVSFIVVMIEISVKGHTSPRDLAMFVPMWLGTAVGISSTILVSRHICLNANLVTKEERLKLREEGRERDALFVDYDSLALLRRLLCWNVGLFMSFLLVFISQILFSLWYIFGFIGLWHALIPSILLAAGYLTYIYLMNVVSLMCCGFVTFAVEQMMLILLKCNGQLPGMSWTLTCMPLYFLLPSALTYTTYILVQQARGHYALRGVQLWAAVSYIVCTLFLSAAVIVTVCREQITGVPLWTKHPYIVQDSDIALVDHVQYMLCLVAVTVFSLCVIAVLNYEGRMVANTRGFRDPVPLSRYPDGWRPTTGAGDIYTILLGTIQVRPPTGTRRATTVANDGGIKLFSTSAAAKSPAGPNYGSTAGPTTPPRAAGTTNAVTPTRAPAAGSVDGIELPVRSNSTPVRSSNATDTSA